MQQPHQPPSFLASEHRPPPPEQARFHILSAPYEASVSYGAGTAKAPHAILEASQQLEVWDGHSNPSEAGIYTHPAVDCDGSPETVLKRIGNATHTILDDGGLPVLIGGEHTVTFGAVRALHDSGEPFGVVQLDAHADLRDVYEGSAWSHACVMRRVLDLGIPLMQVGVRSLSPEEVTLRTKRGVDCLDAKEIMQCGVPEALLPAGFPNRIYLTVDIDVLDAAAMPATGTPEPGGLDWYALMAALENAVRDRTVVGCDLVEFAPIPGFHAYDFTAARLLYNLLGIIAREQETAARRSTGPDE